MPASKVRLGLLPPRLPWGLIPWLGHPERAARRTSGRPSSRWARRLRRLRRGPTGGPVLESEEASMPPRPRRGRGGGRRGRCEWTFAGLLKQDLRGGRVRLRPVGRPASGGVREVGGVRAIGEPLGLPPASARRASARVPPQAAGYGGSCPRHRSTGCTAAAVSNGWSPEWFCPRIRRMHLLFVLVALSAPAQVEAQPRSARVLILAGDSNPERGPELLAEVQGKLASV